MKRIIIGLILILAIVPIALSMLGTGDEYAAEKVFYRAANISKKIAMNPDVAPPAMLSSVEKYYLEILKRYPDTDTAKITRMTLSEFYAVNERYDEAISELDTIIAAEGQNIAMLSRAHYLKGGVYERQDRWDKALEEYVILRDEYAETPVGLQVPLYLGQHYAQEGKEEAADRAYREAVVFYEQLEKEYSGKMLGYSAANMLREVYGRLKDYENAGRVVENIINNYPSQITFIQQLPFVELIFARALGRPEKAIEIYKNIKEKTMNEELIKLLDEAIASFEAKK